ncbi:ATP-binding protein [Methylobacterium nonmethylotrophicum]|uniref:histidine kinase n=1 Tax=Methylobacterium nonmethylotrophicum TaxID=1141884 RepID=A0A4Z0NQW4_9HYPH|nr:ATP-binding protein [Methylobacterium nonmethylotrophicum]TGD99404.1 response regulator [Methylobacterium nonmethylotrophicum]
MSVLRGRPLSHYIASLMLAVLVPAVAITLLLGQRLITAEQARLQDATAASNADAVERIDRFLAGQIAMLRALASSPVFETKDFARFDQQARELASLEGTHIILRDRSGQEIVTTRAPLGASQPRLAREDADHSFAVQGPAVSNLLLDAVTGRHAVRVGVPVIRSGETVYVLLSHIPAAHLGGLLAQAGIAQPSFGSLVDRDGMIIGRSADTDAVAGKRLPGFDEIAERDRGVWIGENIAGVPVVATFRRSTLSGWIVGVGIERTALEAPLRASLWVLIPVVLGLIILALAVSTFVSRTIVMAHHGLVGHARALGDGRVLDPLLTPIRETSEVGAELATASRKIRGQAEALLGVQQVLEERVAERTREAQARQALLTATLDAIDHGLIAFEPDGRLAVANRRAAELLGLDPGFLTGRLTCDAFQQALVANGEFSGVSPVMLASMGLTDAPPAGALYERTRPNGTVLEVRTAVLPDGSVVRTYSDITLRRRAEESMAEAARLAEVARREAEAASAAKSDFLATMSHEIRTPLTGILGYADLLLRQPGLPPAAHRSVERIRGAGTALVTIVNDILDYSSIQSRHVALNPEPFSPRALIEEAVAIVRPNADKKMLSLTCHVEQDVPGTLLGDPGRIRQIVLNLLANAVKFTSEGGVTVTVLCHRAIDAGAPHRLQVAVQDTGIGIPPEKRDRLFRHFSQIDGSTQRDFGGTGLGLAISRRLVEVMDGKIGVASTPGRGSTFFFSIPLPEAIEAAEAVPVRAEMAPPLTRTVRILLAEDDPINQEIALGLLDGWGYTIEVANDGAEAVEAVRTRHYDLVLMDIQMPRMDGITAMRTIRDLDEPCRDVPILAVTANVLPQQVAQFRQAGATGHIGKPFKQQELVAAIERLISLKDPDPGGDETGPPDQNALLDAQAYHDALEQFGTQTMHRLLADLAEEMQSRFTARTSASGREALARDAHGMCSVAGTLGFRAFSAACRDLERACRSHGDVDLRLRRLDVTREATLSRIADLRTA